jgi:acetoin utilization deacetylase AcuC-like enzyme
VFRIRRIHDDVAPEDRAALARVQQILREQLPGIGEPAIAELPARLRNPVSAQFRSFLFVAERRGSIEGFALLLHDPDLHFCYLDFISAARMRTGGGVGGALYQRVRDAALALKTIGIFFECLPDDPELCRNAALHAQNRARLRFYERYGARPIIGTAYETPLQPGGDCPPYLVLDDLGRNVTLARRDAKRIVRAILERRYGDVCPPGYIDTVVDSFRDDPVRLRPPRYALTEPARAASVIAPGRHIALVVNDRHALHHVRERGYVEAPARLRAIIRELDRLDIFERITPRAFAESHITAVHDPGFCNYLRRVCTSLADGKSVYPYVFPIRNATRPPKDLAVCAGYYCIDTFTPLSMSAYQAARHGVDCALTAAQKVLEGRALAYALIRPPGHHAERRAFGGFCYFNNAAIAAHYMRGAGRVAILDIDYHHGNGQQDIFWERDDVLTISIHGDPSFAYPYFSGFAEERGEGPGEGFNLNIPLPEQLDGKAYLRALRRALRTVEDFAPDFLIVALGLDSAKGDPTGTWSLNAADFEANGRAIAALRLPTLVVQEGGYRTRNIGVNARRFLVGLWAERYAGPSVA